MGILAWVMMGLALWHYTIFLPDRFWGGIVGAFLASIAGAIVAGLIIFAFVHGTLAVPGRHDTHLVTVLYAIPGAILGMAIAYLAGAGRERTIRRTG
jgi:ABC-type Fe3+ transport system permease subunit